MFIDSAVCPTVASILAARMHNLILDLLDLKDYWRNYAREIEEHDMRL